MGDRARTLGRGNPYLAGFSALCLALCSEGHARADDCGGKPIVTVFQGRARTTLDVLSFNIEGLGWPARTGRAPKLAEIGRNLAALRGAGQDPDLVLFQE